METLLQLKTSIYSSGGQSSRLADELVLAWRGRNPRSRVIKRDLATDPVPHLTAERFAAFLSKPDERTLLGLTDRVRVRKGSRSAKRINKHRLQAQRLQSVPSLATTGPLQPEARPSIVKRKA